MPQNEILLQIKATKIQVAVLKPQLFGRKLLTLAAGNGNRRRFSRTHNPEIASPHLDVACLHLGVAHLGRTRGNFTLDQDDSLEPQLPGPLDGVHRGPLRIEGDLDQACAITKVKENDPAQISDAVDPATEFDFGAGVRGS